MVRVRDRVMDGDRVSIEIRQIENEPDVQTASRLIGGMALYTKATFLTLSFYSLLLHILSFYC